jgi:membrane protease YdiL (CAAX protease family)
VIVLGSALGLQVFFELVLGFRGFGWLVRGGIPGTRLLEVLFYDLWWPILFLAALVGFGLRRKIPVWIRTLVMGVYASAMIALVPIAAGGSLLAEDIFFLLMRFAPIPASFFLFANGRHAWSLTRCAGFALIFAMLWRSLFLSFPDLLVIAGGGAVTPPAPTSALYRQFFVSVIWDFVYPVVGLMLFLHRVPLFHIAARWGQQLASLLRPFDAWVKRSWGTDVAWGSVLFVLDLVGAILLATFLASGATGEVGDDSAVFNLITLDQVFVIAIIAGVGEELVFRGILQGGLHRLLGRGPLASTMAIVIQAVPFAIVHAGYADLDHVIVPFAFGIFIGYVFRYFGIIPAIMIHTQIDIFAFGASYVNVRLGTPEADLMFGFLGLLFIANLSFGAVWLILRSITWWEGRRRALAALVRS